MPDPTGNPPIPQSPIWQINVFTGEAVEIVLTEVIGGRKLFFVYTETRWDVCGDTRYIGIRHLLKYFPYLPLWSEFIPGQSGGSLRTVSGSPWAVACHNLSQNVVT